MPADPVPPTAADRNATLRRLLRIAWSYRADCLQLLVLQLAVVFLTVAVIALAGQTNHIVNALQIPVDPEFDRSKSHA